MANSHLIGKQVILLEVNTSNGSDAIQQKISELYRNSIVPELNKLFDSIVDENEFIQFDSIELDIGNISLNKNFETEIVDKIIQQLKEKCLKQRNGDNNKFATDDWSKPNPNKRPLREHYFDIWLYWLEHGALPSYSTTPEKNWLELVFETLGLHAKAVDRLQDVIRKTPVALQRLILQHSKEELRSIVELHSGFPQTDLLKMFDELKSLSKEKQMDLTTNEFRAIEIAVWEEVLTLTILKKQKLESVAFASYVFKMSSVKKLVQKIDVSEKSKYPILEEILKKENSEIMKHPIPKEVLEKDNSETRKQSIPKETTDSENSKTGKQSILEKIIKEDNSETPKHLLREEKAEKKESHQTEKKGIDNADIQVEDGTIDEVLIKSPQFFKNAGVVLLHPFLNNLFKKLELLKGAAFKNIKYQTKAVLMVHFLATGDKKPKEYEMVLPKFLCGIPSNLPLDHTLSLSEEEQKEAQNVLKAVIEHWGALGNTSPDGLREGFLKRDGKFIKEQNGWKLYVEQKAQDILLDKLPWNLSMIKLPWMKELLKVEWR